ncbi:GGDEF domain-containing protein [Shewanella oneidensis MR-1]|uniref:diguanylate cyclase n=1 Tax=Shewanella oneidensis (strain ATCC 700550 / JCM 31522 / CIP 106686 / LMG 19005 / NCIMB 14063 / MR-1) TaxID=211586 RepID=Q8EFD2_SHEON|nr:GGDEF domain-containing protein [Shewanella oneidensis]AAN55096.2 diguanylate cyclase [Shewanella oneidensis MR-1]MDX5996206.1 GGDEF domain-containing protein [Shewanella oneidensis]MEE2029464.1 Diguanylate cyclase VdcA [Shewanella oneidensis]QKG96670.1 GGDEF domain-containing protein [Shewanella oneidensis MR-1]
MSSPAANKELDASAQILRLAVPQMSALDIPVTPENYTVWYEYFAQSNLDLNRAIDGFLANNVVFTKEVNTSLYKNFIQEKSPEVIENVQIETQILINSLISKITQLNQGTEAFSNTLADFGLQLQSSPDVNTLNQLVDGVIDEMQNLLVNNQTMEQSLNAMGQEVQNLKTEMENLSLAAMTDQLTSLHNRRAYEIAIQDHIHRAEEQHTRCSLLLIDIDRFKVFNDTYGHQVGDKVLAYVALALKQCVRGDDFVARYGGEEFVVLLPNTHFHDALQVAETLRGRISERRLAIGKDKKLSLGAITVSIGLASLQKGDDAETLFSRADKALYEAKSDGRNCVRG